MTIFCFNLTLSWVEKALPYQGLPGILCPNSPTNHHATLPWMFPLNLDSFFQGNVASFPQHTRGLRFRYCISGTVRYTDDGSSWCKALQSSSIDALQLGENGIYISWTRGGSERVPGIVGWFAFCTKILLAVVAPGIRQRHATLQ